MDAVNYFNKQADDNGYFDINQNRDLNTEMTKEQQNETAKRFLIGQEYNKGGISNTFVNGLTDRSKYDYDINWNENPFKSNDIGDLRAEAQGGLGRLKDATINNITIAGTTALSSSIGFVGGVISAAIQGDASKIWDNDFTNKLNELQKGVTESNQIYRGQEYQNKSFLGKLTDGIFWADLWQNAGYMEGMLIPGTAIGKAAKATQIAAKFPKMTKVATNLIAASGEASMEALNQKDEAYDNLFNQATDLYYNRLELAKNDTERRSAYDEYLSNLDLIKSDAVKQGNRTFGGNMILLTATGTLEFGDFVSRGYGESHKLLNRIARNELGQATAKGLGSDIAKGTGQFLKNFTVEGLEEYTQRGAASGAANTKDANQFLSKYADELNIELADNYLQAVGQAWVDDFDNEEAWLEFMSGAILGGIGLPGSHNGIRAQISDAKKEGDLRRKLAQEINEKEAELGINPTDLKRNGKLQETLDFLIREQGITKKQRDALYNRDKNEFVNSRVEDILNYAYLYDNIGELDEFKERLKQYSTIDNQDQLTNEDNGLVALTKDGNGNSPFKDKSVSEANQLLKESYDFWNKTIDSYIQGKQILDTMSKGKLDDNTLKRGAISFAQSRNFKDRAGELYNDLNNNLNKYQESITKVSNDSKDIEFINNFFERIKNLSENEVLPTFGSTKTVSSIYALTDFVNKNSSKIDSEVVNDIINPIVDLIKVSYDYYAYNNDFNSILKNAEKEQSKTDKMFNNLKNVKKNYLVKRYAKRLDGISDRKTLQEQIKNVPAEIREDVIDYLRDNGSENTRKTFDDIQEWDNVSRAITKVIDSFDETRFPVNRKAYNDEYGSDVVDNTLNIIKDAFNNSSSRNEITDNINAYLDKEREAIDTIENADEKLARQNNLRNTEKLLNDILKKIDEYSNNERNESNKKKNDSKKKKENVDLNEEEETDNELVEFDIPNYIIDKYIKAIKNNDIEKIKKYLEELKDFDKLPQMIKMAFRLKKDETGNKNRTFLEEVLNTLEGNETAVEGKETEDGGYDGNTSDTPETEVVKLSELQPSQNDEAESQGDNFDEEDKSAPDEQFEVNTLLSMAISKYNHEKATNGRKQLYDENDPIYKLVEEYGGYDFVDDCRLDDFIKYCKKNNINLTNVVKFIKTSVDYGDRIDPVYILALEADNAFFERIKEKTPEKVTQKINIDGKNYQVIGTMQYRKSSEISQDEFNKLKSIIDEVGDVEVGQFKLSLLTNGIAQVNAGRLVFANNNRFAGNESNNVGLSTLLKDIPNEDFEIGVYTDSKTLKLYDSVDSKKLVKPVTPLVGSVYLFVRCADGRYYPRLIRSKKLTADELNLNDANDEFIRRIKECIRTMCDTSVSDERLKAKDDLAELIAFTTDKYKVKDLIWFDGDNIVVGNSAGERVRIKASKDDETVEKIFNAMINLPDLKLTPRIHIGGAGNYNGLKNLLRKSTIVTSDVELRSIDCNFELFATDEQGNVVVDNTKTSSTTKTGKIGTDDGKIFSFNSNQIKEITQKLKKHLPADLMNIDSIKVVKKTNDNNTSFDFYINNSDEPLSENYNIYNILNWIYNQIQAMPEYSFNKEYEILFKASKNSNNTYSLTIGKNAIKENDRLNRIYKSQEQEEAAQNIPTKKDISSEPTEEPEKPTKTKKKEGKSSVIELGEAELSQGKKPKSQFDSIYKGNTDNQKADDETQECGENPPF